MLMNLKTRMSGYIHATWYVGTLGKTFTYVVKWSTFYKCTACYEQVYNVRLIARLG